MMNGFLYYISGKTPSVTAAEIAECGLGYAIPAEKTAGGVIGGPDGLNGVILADARRVQSHRVAYKPDAQTWRRVPGTTGAWVGMWNDGVPGPADLARDKQLAGHFVTLGDEREWLIPVARGLVENEDAGRLEWYTALPQRRELNDAGEWVSGDVMPKYGPLWDLACRWFDATRGLGDGRQVFAFDGADDGAVLALGYNYAGLGGAEVSLLGLFDERIVGQVLQAVIDGPVFDDFLKKKLQPDG